MSRAHGRTERLELDLGAVDQVLCEQVQEMACVHFELRLHAYFPTLRHDRLDEMNDLQYQLWFLFFIPGHSLWQEHLIDLYERHLTWLLLVWAVELVFVEL